MRAGAFALCVAALAGCGGSPGPGVTGAAGTGGAGTNGPPMSLPGVTGTFTLTLLAGEIDTVAAAVSPRDGVGGKARFLVNPSSMAVDGAGLLYATDSSLRRIDLATGAVTTVDVHQAPSPQWPLTSPKLVAAGPGGDILVAFPAFLGQTLDAGGLSQLRNGALEPLFRISAFFPLTLAADGAGAFFVQVGQTFTQHQILFADPTAAKVTEVVGNADTLVADITGFAGDGAGTLFLADATACVIVERKPTGEAVPVAGEKGTCAYVDAADAGARLGEPRALAFDGKDGLYVLDGPTLRLVKTSTGAITTLLGASITMKPEVGTPGQLFRPTSLAPLPRGAVAIADSHAVFVATSPTN